MSNPPKNDGPPMYEIKIVLKYGDDVTEFGLEFSPHWSSSHFKRMGEDLIRRVTDQYDKHNHRK